MSVFAKYLTHNTCICKTCLCIFGCSHTVFSIQVFLSCFQSDDYFPLIVSCWPLVRNTPMSRLALCWICYTTNVRKISFSPLWTEGWCLHILIVQDKSLLETQSWNHSVLPHLIFAHLSFIISMLVVATADPWVNSDFKISFPLHSLSSPCPVSPHAPRTLYLFCFVAVRTHNITSEMMIMLLCSG